MRDRTVALGAGALALVAVALTAGYLVADPDAERRRPVALPEAEELQRLAPYAEGPDSIVSGYVVPETRLTAEAFDDGELPPVPVEQTPPSAPEPPRSWQVSAILIADDQRLAIVNDSVVGIGDPLPGGARVVAIESDHVVLRSSSGARTVLRF